MIQSRFNEITTFADAMQNEIIRLTRKELRAELDGLRKAAALQRMEILELKRLVASLQKLVGRTGNKTTKAISESNSGREEPVKRFSAKGFATHRKRLGLSAEETGTLVGASAQTVYGWEKGRRSQKRQMEAIAAFRRMGKKEARTRLDSSES